MKDKVKDWDSFINFVEKMYQDLQSEKQYIIELKDGRIIAQTTKPVVLETGEIIARTWSFSDITSLLLIEKSLKKRDELYSSIFENTYEAIFVYDLDQDRVIDANNSFMDYLGYTLEDIKNLSPYEFIQTEEEQVNRTIEEIIEKGSIQIGERIWQRKDGTTLDVFVTASVVDIASQNLILVIARDITEEKKLYEEQLKNEHLKSLGVLAGGIAHDFNNYLTAILGNIELVKLWVEESDYFDGKTRILDTIQNTTETLNESVGLTKQLLTFSAGGKPLMSTVNIIKVLKNTLNLFLSGSNITLRTDFEDTSIYVNADTSMLSQVFSNMTLNAMDAMKNMTKPIIEVKVSLIENDVNISNELENHSSYVKIIFKDYGVGISSEHIDNIFDPYFSTKSQGSGLGLAISHSIIKDHNGRITVDSTLNKGTTFEIILPETKKVDDKSSEMEDFNDKTKSKSILVMDDEEDIREVMTSMLETLGHRVGTVKNGEEIIEIIENTNSNVFPYDIVILDVTIKGGLGAKETIEEINQLKTTPKTIVMSGYSESDLLTNYNTYGFDARLSKPVGLNKLEDLINEITEDTD